MSPSPTPSSAAPTLLQRAHAFLASALAKAGKAAAIAAVPLGVAVGGAAVDGTARDARAATFQDGGTFGYDYGISTYGSGGVNILPGGLTVKAFGNSFDVPFQSSLSGGGRFLFLGALNGPVDPGQVMRLDYNFSLSTSGSGGVAVSYLTYRFTASETPIFTRTLIEPQLSASGSPQNGGLRTYLGSDEFTLGTLPSQPDGWEIELGLDLSAFSDGDTFNVTIPSNSIDLTFVAAPVPEPGWSLAMLTATVGGSVVFRRMVRVRRVKSSA